MLICMRIAPQLTDNAHPTYYTYAVTRLWLTDSPLIRKQKQMPIIAAASKVC
jgi:hypothetical protein